MSFGPTLAAIAQVSVLPDTLITRAVPTRDLLAWSTGILELVVLLLGGAVLVAILMLVVAVRHGVMRVSAAAVRLADDTRPMLQEASAAVAEARAMAATVRDDVSRVTGAAGAMGDHLMEATEATAQRIREVGAVLDIVQEELEETALAGAQAMRGLRIGGLALLNRRRKRRRSSATESPDVVADHLDPQTPRANDRK